MLIGGLLFLAGALINFHRRQHQHARHWPHILLGVAVGFTGLVITDLAGPMRCLRRREQ
jgi:uncharacterized membrane protein HdeD (DUF308 family)